MKYTLSYSFDEGIQGGILGMVGRRALTKEEVIQDIDEYVLLREWSKWLKEIKVSIKKSAGK